MIFFTADLHFGHANIIKYCRRPFGSVEEMDKALAANWNSRVSDKDDVYILGDFTKTTAQAHKYLSLVRGNKYFICGNHDEFLKKAEFSYLWAKEYHRLVYKGYQFVLFHYPIFEWDALYRGAVHLHGHVHGGTVSSRGKRIFDVGVDSNHFTPCSIEEILTREQVRDEYFLVVDSGVSPP